MNIFYLRTKMIGKHNVYNTLAVAAALMEAGFDIKTIKDSFSDFTGMKRRFQLVGEVKGALIYDDYAHHPTEVKSLIASLEAFKDNDVIAVFQPHRYTRLQKFWKEFIEALKPVNKLIVTDVFAASEDVIEGVNSKAFVEHCKEAGLKNVEYIEGSMAEVAEKIYTTINSKNVIIGIGAGTITQLGPELLKLDKE